MRFTITVYVLMLSAWSSDQERTWTDAAGSFSFNAEAVSAQANAVRLRWTDDNKEYDVPLHLLSEADRRYVRERFTTVRKSTGGRIPDEVLDAIRQAAARQWPDNFQMQQFVIGEEKAAYLWLQSYAEPTVPPMILTRIRQVAAEKWPEKYGMQKFAIEQEVRAFKGLNSD